MPEESTIPVKRGKLVIVYKEVARVPNNAESFKDIADPYRIIDRRRADNIVSATWCGEPLDIEKAKNLYGTAKRFGDGYKRN